MIRVALVSLWGLLSRESELDTDFLTTLNDSDTTILIVDNYLIVKSGALGNFVDNCMPDCVWKQYRTAPAVLHNLKSVNGTVVSYGFGSGVFNVQNHGVTSYNI